MQWYQASFFVLAVALQVVKLSYQLPPQAQPVGDYTAKLLQKLEKIQESNAENAAVFKKQLAEQAIAIDKFQDLKESLQQISEQNLNLSDAIQQLQEKQLRAENAFNRNTFAVRLFLQTAGLKLGDMLISAVRDNDVPLVQLLLQLGAPIESQDSKTNRAIHVAVQNRHAGILEILLDNQADIESKGENQKTALHVAGYSECLECAEILIKKGARLESRDEWLNTPIIHPARIGFNDFVELLIQKGANINAAQRDGITSLHWAARDGQLSTVMLLVKNGADVRLKTRDGKTVLDNAKASNHHLIVAFLENLKDV